jgi:flagellar protein FlaJ
MKSEDARERGESQDLVLAPYRLMGDAVSRLLPLFKGLDKTLLKANMKVAFPAYVAFTVFYSAVGAASIFTPSLLLGLTLGATLKTALLVAFTLGSLSGIVIFAALYLYPSMQADTRKRILDEELPYVASHMAVLSKAGLPPERIFRSMAGVGSSGFRSVAAEEARNIVRDVSLLGYDVISAMRRCIQNSPSKRFVDFLDGFISVTRSGGDLTAYFLSSAKAFMEAARIAARQLVETLGGLAEAYVSMMVVFPLIVVIMLSVMGMIGGGLGGFSPVTVMEIVTYAVVPMMALILLLLLDSIMPPR